MWLLFYYSILPFLIVGFLSVFFFSHLLELSFFDSPYPFFVVINLQIHCFWNLDLGSTEAVLVVDLFYHHLLGLGL